MRVTLVNDRSQLGHFGWVTLFGVHLPYIFRLDGQYCAVHILRTQLAARLPVFGKMLGKIQHIQMSSCESALFNEINKVHCDSQLSGRYSFSERDCVVSILEFLQCHPSIAGFPSKCDVGVQSADIIEEKFWTEKALSKPTTNFASQSIAPVASKLLNSQEF